MKQIIKRFIVLALMATCSMAMAGGTYVIGKVSQVYADGSDVKFRFAQVDTVPPLLLGCRAFAVTVVHQRVPWYSSWPGVRSSHPSEAESREAVALLMSAHSEDREVAFGYMGNGLVQTAAICSFVSKGLLLGGRKNIVLSFHDPV